MKGQVTEKGSTGGGAGLRRLCVPCGRVPGWIKGHVGVGCIVQSQECTGPGHDKPSDLAVEWVFGEDWK